MAGSLWSVTTKTPGRWAASSSPLSENGKAAARRGPASAGQLHSRRHHSGSFLRLGARRFGLAAEALGACSCAKAAKANAATVASDVAAAATPTIVAAKNEMPRCITRFIITPQQESFRRNARMNAPHQRMRRYCAGADGVTINTVACCNAKYSFATRWISLRRNRQIVNPGIFRQRRIFPDHRGGRQRLRLLLILAFAPQHKSPKFPGSWPSPVLSPLPAQFSIRPALPPTPFRLLPPCAPDS